MWKLSAIDPTLSTWWSFSPEPWGSWTHEGAVFMLVCRLGVLFVQQRTRLTLKQANCIQNSAFSHVWIASESMCGATCEHVPSFTAIDLPFDSHELGDLISTSQCPSLTVPTALRRLVVSRTRPLFPHVTNLFPAGMVSCGKPLVVFVSDFRGVCRMGTLKLDTA